MKTLEPSEVAARLAELRAIATLETVDEAERRLEAERPRRVETFEAAVARRLAELRDLLDASAVLRAAPKR